MRGETMNYAIKSSVERFVSATIRPHSVLWRYVCMHMNYMK